jgi:hypothetical protein
MRNQTENFSVLVTACNIIFSFLKDKELDVLNLRAVICFPEENEGILVQIVKPAKKAILPEERYLKVQMKKSERYYKLEIKKRLSEELLYRICFGKDKNNKCFVEMHEEECIVYKRCEESRVLDVSI